MGEIEVNTGSNTITIFSHIITYGDASSHELTQDIREEIETMWNEPKGTIHIDGNNYLLQFSISAAWQPTISELDVLQNVDPRNNYFRIETYAQTHISFVDGIGCNTGYFLLENLYKGSTTAAHEYGHTLGLEHPADLDLRGQGVPGIMYPRGTLVDAIYQYDPSKPAGVTGGTMHPMHRKVLPKDIQLLHINKLRFRNRKAIIGDFTNIYHWNHQGATDENV